MRNTALILALALALAPATGSAAKKKKKGAGKHAAVTQPVETPASDSGTPAGDTAGSQAAAAAPAGTAAASSQGSATTPAAADLASSQAAATAPGTTAVPAVATSTSAGGLTAGGGSTSAAGLHEVEAAPVGAPGLAEPPHEGTMPHAQPAGHGLSIAAKLGGTYPTSKLALTYMGSLELAWAPPVVRDLLPLGTLTVGLEVGYVQPKLSSSATDGTVGGDYSYRLDQRLVTADLDATLVVPLRVVKAYGGAGLGLYLLRAQIDSFGKVNTETQTRSGLQLRGGLSLPMGPGDVFGELRYHYVHLQFLSTGSSNAGGVTVAAGYRYSF